MTVRPDFSVVVPAYGTRGGALERCIQSVLQHDRDDIELIVVDDCTPDDSVATLTDSLGVRCVRRETNGGVAAAQNTGVEAMTGRYVTFLHSDDEFPGDRPWPRLEGGIVAGCLTYGKTVRPSPLATATPEHFLHHRFGVHISACVFDRSLLLRIPFDADLRCWEDWDILYRMTAANIAVVRHPSSFATVRDDARHRLSLSPSMAEALMLLYEKHDAVRSTRRLRSHWEYKIGRLLVLTGRPAEGRRWLTRSIVSDPLHPRRLMMSARLAAGASRPTRPLQTAASRARRQAV